MICLYTLMLNETQIPQYVDHLNVLRHFSCP